MTQCPMCGAECDSTETCPSCGSRLKDSTLRKKDAEYLAKDRWTFGELARDARAEKKEAVVGAPTKPGIGRDPTQVMHQLREPTPRSIEKKIESTTKTKAGVGRDPTLTLGAAKEAAAAKSKKKAVETPATTAGMGAPSTKALHVFKEGPAGEEKRDANAEVSETKPTIVGLSALNIPSNTLPIPLQNAAPRSSVEGSSRTTPSSEDGGPKQERVNIESESVSTKATAPLEIRMGAAFAPHKTTTTREDSAPARDSQRDSSTRDRVALRGRGRPSINLQKSKMRVGLAASSAILILVWFVPDVWTANPVLPYTLLGAVHGMDLVALLACPTLGAVLLALLIAPVSPSSKAVVALPVGLAALAIPLLTNAPPLPLRAEIIIAGAVVNIAGAVAVFTQTEYKVFGHIALILVPGTLTGIAAIGIVLGRLPLAQLSALKTPLTIYAAMLVSAMASSVLLQSLRRKTSKTA